MYALKSCEYVLYSTGFQGFLGTFFASTTGCFDCRRCSRNSIILDTANSLRFAGLVFSNYDGTRSVSSNFLFFDDLVIPTPASC